MIPEVMQFKGTWEPGLVAPELEEELRQLAHRAVKRATRYNFVMYAFRKCLLVEAFKRAGLKVQPAAKLLGITRQTFTEHLDNLGIPNGRALK